MVRRNIAYEHLAKAEEAFLRARNWVRSKRYLNFKQALDQSKYHDRKHGAHLAVEKLYEASRIPLNETQPDTSQVHETPNL